VLERLNGAPLWAIGIGLLVVLVSTFALGHYLNLRYERIGRFTNSTDFSGYVVTAMLGLLAIVMAFTFSLSSERFEERRQLVIAQANAIGTAYLQAQLFDSPYRERLSGLLRAYTKQQVALANSGYPESGPLREQNNKLVTNIWKATEAAFNSVRNTAFASLFVASVNRVIDLDATRAAVRATRLPTEIFSVLCLFLISVAGVLGYEIGLERGLLLTSFVLGLMVMAFLLVLDLDRPQSGGIRETQGPMEQLQISLGASSGPLDPRRNGPHGH